MPELEPSFQPQSIFEQYGEPSNAELGIEPIEPLVEPGGFMHGAMNSPEVIAGLTELNDRPIEDIEADMRRSRMGEDSDVLLGKGKGLIETMLDQTAYVESLGLTHEEIADTLLRAIALGRDSADKIITIAGTQYQIQSAGYLHLIPKPFSADKDDQIPNTFDTITNLETGVRVAYSRLLPQNVKEFGFYTGEHAGEYAVSPRAIINTFTHLRDKAMQAEGSGFEEIPESDPVAQLLRGDHGDVVTVRTFDQAKRYAMAYASDLPGVREAIVQWFPQTVTDVVAALGMPPIEVDRSRYHKLFETIDLSIVEAGEPQPLIIQEFREFEAANPTYQPQPFALGETLLLKPFDTLENPFDALAYVSEIQLVGATSQEKMTGDLLEILQREVGKGNIAAKYAVQILKKVT